LSIIGALVAITIFLVLTVYPSDVSWSGPLFLGTLFASFYGYF
jgi:hypothetical protein